MKKSVIAGLMILGITLISSVAFAAEGGAGMIPVIQWTVLAAGLVADD